jgi:feruloyl-CoA synthase
MAHLFRAHADQHPDRVLATQRHLSATARAGGLGGLGGPESAPQLTQLSWGQAREQADRLAQALLDRGLGPDRPLLILSGNSLDHLLLVLAAYTAGVPVMPVSTAYSLQSTGHERIRAIADLCSPGMVFADDGDAYAPALAALKSAVPHHLTSTGGGDGDGGAETLSDLITSTSAGDDVEQAFSTLSPDTVAKILFTSGSTGTPKGVINTQRMLCSNQRAIGQVWPFLSAEPPLLVDWLPWSHTFGGNHNLGQVLTFGGTIHIDDGRPVPQLFDLTVQALADNPPTVYYNVPTGFALLAPRLEQDREFAARFFSRLRLMFYAAAALPDALWQRLRNVADEVADRHVPLTASWGSTETAPAATSAHFSSATCGCIGVPLPGVTLKLVPSAGKLEVRLIGPNVTPGYYSNPQATAAAFDEEGFYRTGDAVRWVDETDPGQGLMFDGRLAEDFKLSTGTWVHVGQLRTRLISAAGGVIRDAVIAGQDHTYVAALAWVNPVEAQRICATDGVIPLDHPDLRTFLAGTLASLNAGQGSASRIERLLLLEAPPDIEAGEFTDKGYINQRLVLARRAADVAQLLAEPAPHTVITPYS